MIFSKSAELAWLRVGREQAIQIERKAPEPAPRGCSFYAPDFALKSSLPWLLGETVPLRLSAEALPPLRAHVLPEADDFTSVHAEILKRIGRHEFVKVVPVVGEQFEFSGPVHAGMFMPGALQPRAGQFNYGFEFSGEGLCGVTPELLFHVRGHHLTTMAVAGTGPVDGPSLLDDKKERHEHQLVIEHIVADLKPWGTADVGTTIERNFGTLKHLYTPIEQRLTAKPRFMDLVHRLHPTPALGGWPRTGAVAWLEQQAFHAGRKRHGAPFGYVTDEEMVCVVAIRGIQWAGAHAQLVAGCGVVEQSRDTREWSELQLKMASTRRMLGMTL